MNKQEVTRYFHVLAREIDFPCRVILTGAGAGTVYGRVRATLDLDFALEIKARSETSKAERWRKFGEASSRTALRTGIAAQYSEDIDRWSSITYLDYRRHTIPFHRFGSIEVRLLHPAYWAIGKMTRYLDPDIRDLCDVLKRTRTSPEKLSKVLGRALLRSPKSTSCELFRKQTEDFMKTFGPKIWGRDFDSNKTIANFHRAAGIRKV